MRRAPFAVAGLVALACTTPRTEVLLVIDTDLEVPSELNGLRVDLIGPNGEPRQSEGGVASPADLPRTLGIVDRTHSARTVRVTVTGLLHQANVVQRRAVFTFVPHETRILRIDLLRACVGVVCPAEQTCAENGCRPMEIAPAELAPYDPDVLARRDGGVARDGGDGGGCSPSEICNGEDDDCDGEADEGFDLLRDPANCGRCGEACAVDPENAASVCEAGSCVLRCDPGFEDCDGDATNGCEAALSKPGHCGDCDRACGGPTPFCEERETGYACVASCEPGRTACGGSCVDVTSDPLRCGDCDTRCEAPPNAVATCMGGACDFECDPGYANCDGVAANGCESSLRELANCGRCGARCERPGAVTSCATGSCEIVGCQPLRGDCDGDPENGCEADLGSLATCGACDNACPTGVSQGTVACMDGSCRLTCAPGYGSCDGVVSNGCEQSLADPRACGACGVACSEPTPFCQAVPGGHACTEGCGSGTACGASCVDTSRDPAHCGGCDRVCPTAANATAVCTGGACGLECANGWADCDGTMENGCETSTATDPASCGGCGNACPVLPNAVARCTAGTCRFECVPGYADCNGAAGDGCEVRTAADPDHCGECGRRCTLGGGATAVECAEGACRITSCEAGLADCDGSPANGCEVDTRVNRNHCGGCGTACGPGRRCCDGSCVRPPDC